MNMRDALDPDDCDKMNHFFSWLLSIDSTKEPGHKVDLTKAIWEYRREYGQPRTSDKLLTSLKDRIKRKCLECEKYRATLEKYKAFPIPFVAKILGKSDKVVAHWYKKTGIVRPFNYKGRRFDGVAQ